MVNERSELHPQPVPFALWSDSQLLTTALRYGEQARTWRNKFLGLLPEIDRRKLYEQKGFSSIVHFAKVIGGIGEEQLCDVIRFEERLRETPLLHELLVSGKVSMHKIERVLSVAEPANDEFLANQVQLLSKAGIDTLVRDMKYIEPNFPDVRNENEATEEIMQIAVPLDPEVAKGLLELREKGIDIDQELKEFLEQRKRDIKEKKEAIGEKCKPTNSRHIPKATRDILKKEHGPKCSIQNCRKPWTETHHTQRFALAKTHDPRYMALMCAEHHDIAHSIDVKVQEKRKRSA